MLVLTVLISANWCGSSGSSLAPLWACSEPQAVHSVGLEALQGIAFTFWYITLFMRLEKKYFMWQLEHRYIKVLMVSHGLGPGLYYLKSHGENMRVSKVEQLCGLCNNYLDWDSNPQLQGHINSAKHRTKETVSWCPWISNSVGLSAT